MDIQRVELRIQMLPRLQIPYKHRCGHINNFALFFAILARKPVRPRLLIIEQARDFILGRVAACILAGDLIAQLNRVRVVSVAI